jgi:hypothetical protein
VPAAETFTVDLYPDLRELDQDELCPVPGMTIAGKPAYLYSAWNRKTVLRHFQSGAEASGRTFAIEYDITGANPQSLDQTRATTGPIRWMY